MPGLDSVFPMRCKRIVVMALAVLVAGGCVSRTAEPDTPPEPPKPPTHDEVQWTSTLCDTVGELNAKYERGRDILATPANQFTAIDAKLFIDDVPSIVSSYSSRFDSFDDSGIYVADKYVWDLAAALAGIEPQISELLAGHTPYPHMMPDDEAIALVGPILELLESAQPGKLSELVKASPKFAAAYELAPGCVPPDPPSSSSSAPPPANVAPSEAEDGENLQACADGTCEVVITGSATVTVASFTIEATVADDELTTVEHFEGGGQGSGTLGLGGSITIGHGDESLTITLNGIDGDTAVVEFSLR